MQEYEEAPGYENIPGWVKGNPLNNESYLAKCKEEYPEWADILQETHDKISEICPEYNISQIKDKFGLRYYVSVPPGTHENIRKEVFSIALEAERNAAVLK